MSHQAKFDVDIQVGTSTSTENATTPTLRRQMFSAENFKNEDDGLHYYTGQETYSRFQLVLDILGPAANQLNYFRGDRLSLFVEDQLFLTLMRFCT